MGLFNLGKSASENKPNNKVISRDQLIDMLKVALRTKSLRFARELAGNWLAIYPGDIEITTLLAEAHLLDNRVEDATQIAYKVIARDPLNLDVIQLLEDIRRQQGKGYRDVYLSQISNYVLNPEAEGNENVIGWPSLLKSAYMFYREKKYAKSEVLLHQVLNLKPNFVLTALLHLLLTQQQSDLLTARKLAESYHKRWPDCLQFALVLAELRVATNDDAGGMQLLHGCVVSDPSAIAAKRLWGTGFRYKPMWPEQLEIPLDVAVPFEVAQYFGWTTLTEGDSSKGYPKSEDHVVQLPTAKDMAMGQDPRRHIEMTQPIYPAVDMAPDFTEEPIPADEIYVKLTKKLGRPELQKSDGRYPVYVVLTSKKQIDAKYGGNTSQVLHNEISKLSAAVRNKTGWGSVVFYPDDADSMLKFGLSPIDSLDPMKIKMAMIELDKSLSKKGSMIGAVLIVGGDSIVPFHKLQNPTDDVDSFVYSDNPYASADKDYFIPDWQLGRIPDDNQNDGGLLLVQLRKITGMYMGGATPQPVTPVAPPPTQVPTPPARPTTQPTFNPTTLVTIANIIRQFFSRVKFFKKSKAPDNFGYTASVWRRASISVFDEIGKPEQMRISPPHTYDSIGAEPFNDAPYAYFNLHGTEDSPNWYGQRDVLDPVSGADYPIALAPNLIRASNLQKRVVFSEACYGANIFDKNDATAISLKFMSAGANCFIGSTCIAYGSISTPLIGADLLASLFWKYFNNGHGAGEAFLRAKIDFVEEMKRRQNLLDGEDQKTLLSFVLLGDPLFGSGAMSKKGTRIIRTHQTEKINILSDLPELQGDEEKSFPQKLLQEAKVIVDSYLPGLSGGEMSYTTQVLKSIGKNGIDQSPVIEQGQRPTKVTIKKQISQDQRTHYHFARVTFNNEGKMTKLAISR